MSNNSMPTKGRWKPEPAVGAPSLWILSSLLGVAVVVVVPPVVAFVGNVFPVCDTCANSIGETRFLFLSFLLRFAHALLSCRVTKCELCKGSSCFHGRRQRGSRMRRMKKTRSIHRMRRIKRTRRIRDAANMPLFLFSQWSLASKLCTWITHLVEQLMQ